MTSNEIKNTNDSDSKKKMLAKQFNKKIKLKSF